MAAPGDRASMLTTAEREPENETSNNKDTITIISYKPHPLTLIILTDVISMNIQVLYTVYGEVLY